MTTNNSVQSIIYSIKEDQDQAQFSFVQDQAVLLAERATVALQPGLKWQINPLIMNEEQYFGGNKQYRFQRSEWW